MKDASEDVSQGPGPDPKPSRQRAACPPKRLLIGYEHARCNTNTDVILPAALPDLSTERTAEAARSLAETIDAFEPTVRQLADRHKPTCPICNQPMGFAVWGPHDDEVEGRWPIGSIDAPTTAARSWRNSGVAWFWGTDREDFGSVIRQAGHYVATTARGSAEFDILGDAKTFVEEHSS